MTNQTIDGVPLLPCPFCGDTPEITKHHREEIYGLIHRCPVAGAISWGFIEDPALHVKRWNRRHVQEQTASVAVVPELTSELRWILGQMCFQHIHTAQALRLMGHQIARKAEDEQAVTIYWMLGHYLKDPKNWRENATAEMKAAAPAA